MEAAIAKPRPVDDDIHMGSEYTDARTYLAQIPRAVATVASRRKPERAPQHGSNDSDFGMPNASAE